MRKEKKVLLLIEIKNSSDNYAKLMQLIELAEFNSFKNIHVQSKNSVKFNEDEDIFKSIHVQSKEITESYDEVLKTCLESSNKQVKSLDDFLKSVENSKNNNRELEFYYAVIINNNDKFDIVNLQNYFLILQLYESICNKITLIFRGKDGKCLQDDMYFKLSHFLQFINKNFKNIFVLDKNNSLIKLIENNDGVQKTFLPLFEIDETSKNLLTKNINIKYNISSLTTEWKYLYKNFTVPDSTETYTKISELLNISSKILFNNLNGNDFNKNININGEKKTRKTLLLEIFKNIFNGENINIITLLFFSALIATNSTEDLCDFDKIKKYYKNIINLSQAVIELLDNIVNHSQLKKGFFTFRIQKNEEHINKQFKKYDILNKTALEIYVSDININNNIISNFANSQKGAFLYDYLNTTKLSDFFEENSNSVNTPWSKLKETQKKGYCHGLYTFRDSIKTFNGAFIIKSSETYLANENHYYYKNYQQHIESYVDLFEKKQSLPGTQFSFIINNLQNNFIEEISFDTNIFNTTYDDLVNLLDIDLSWTGIEYDIFDRHLAGNHEYNSQLYKEDLIKKIKYDINKDMNKCINDEKFLNDIKKTILNIDLSKFDNYSNFKPLELDVLCKCLLTSNYFSNYYCIVFDNVDSKFVSKFVSTYKIEYNSNDEILNILFKPKQLNNEFCFENATTLYNILKNTDNALLEQSKNVFAVYLIFKKTADTNMSMFESEMYNRAKNNILSSNNLNQGYKIENTHLRLGNKIHIDDFYEMSLFFENIHYAYYTAYFLLKKIMETLENLDNVDEEIHTILLYGYASYSGNLVWSILQMLEKHLKNKSKTIKIEFAIYQCDLQLKSTKRSVQMYYSFDPNKLEHEKIHLIQIVPIVSTLKTFYKMNNTLNFDLSEKTDKKITIDSKLNLTACWVKNDEIHSYFNTGKLWTKIDNTNKKIELPNKEIIHFLISIESIWRDPLECEKCFPTDVLMEYPLVETDLTSTVPTQQMYRENLSNYQYLLDEHEKNINYQRISKLYKHVHYKHVKRGENHYQYYIILRNYFLANKDDIKNWIINLNKNCTDENANAFNILVIPKHESNVEFGQFFHEYYFKGNADSIIINTEKVFRSNFELEYQGLKYRIDEAINNKREIKFYYLDTGLYSGTTFRRTESLILYFFPNHNKRYVFERVFLLLNRNSNKSKENYVDKEHFHSYVHLNISAIRSFGDSCIVCTSESEGKKLHKISVNKELSTYWLKKKSDRKITDFSSLENSELKDYLMLACTHHATNLISLNRGKNVESYYKAIIKFLCELIDNTISEKPLFKLPLKKLEHEYLNIDSNNNLLKLGFKILSKPFLSYDYKHKCAILDILLLISEILLDNIYIKENKLYHKTKENNIENISNKSYIISSLNDVEEIITYIENDDKMVEVEFIVKTIFLCLSEIKSNYLYNENTILSFTDLINNINLQTYSKSSVDDLKILYASCVQKVINTSSDEIKSVKLEEITKKLFEDKSHYDNKNLQSILELLYMENIQIIFNAILEINTFDCEDKISQYISQYIDNNSNLNKFIDNTQDVLIALKEIYKILNQTSKSGNDNINNDIVNKYKNFKSALLDLTKKHFKSSYHDDSVIIFGLHSEKANDNKKNYLNLPEFFVIENIDDIELSTESENILNKNWGNIKTIINDANLISKGYYYIESTADSEKKYDIIIQINNVYDLKKYNIDNDNILNLSPIYIYIQSNSSLLSNLNLIRLILMFRNSLTSWLIKDFNNNTFSQFAQQKKISKILLKDRVADHIDVDLLSSMQKTVMTIATDDNGKGNLLNTMLEKDYITSEFKLPRPTDILTASNLNDTVYFHLILSYVNAKIARLYRTVIYCEVFYESLSSNFMQKHYVRNDELNNNKLKSPLISLDQILETKIYNRYYRTNLFYPFYGLCNFEVQNTPVITETFSKFISDLREKLSIFKIESNNEFYYSVEYFACLFIDYIYSAMKNSEIWVSKKISEDVVLRINECIEKKDKLTTIKIYRIQNTEHNCDTLVIENATHRFNNNNGLSLISFEWYIDNLFSLNNDQKLNNESNKESEEKTNKLIYFEKEQVAENKINIFRLKLNILKKEQPNDL